MQKQTFVYNVIDNNLKNARTRNFYEKQIEAIPNIKINEGRKISKSCAGEYQSFAFWN